MTGTRYGAIAVVGLWAMTLGFASAAVVADAPASAVQSTTRATANEYCPVMVGTKTEPDLWLDYAGQRIYFCHEVCKARFRRAPEKYLGNLPVAMQEAIREHQQVVAAAERPGDAVESLAPDHRGTSGLRRVGRFLGQFHPVVVHLPIGLLLAGALAEVLFIWRRAQWLSDAARFCVLLGAVAAVGAASLGWLSAMSAGYGGELARVHRIDAIVAVGAEQ